MQTGSKPGCYTFEVEDFMLLVILRKPNFVMGNFDKFDLPSNFTFPLSNVFNFSLSFKDIV